MTIDQLKDALLHASWICSVHDCSHCPISYYDDKEDAFLCPIKSGKPSEWEFKRLMEG